MAHYLGHRRVRGQPSFTSTLLAMRRGLETKTSCLAPLTFASFSYDSFHLLMPLYVCRRFWGIPEGREGQALKWVRPNKLRDYPMPPADEPLIPFLTDLL